MEKYEYKCLKDHPTPGELTYLGENGWKDVRDY